MLSKDWHILERLVGPDRRGDVWLLVSREVGGLSEEKALERAAKKARCDSNLLVAFKPSSMQHSRT